MSPGTTRGARLAWAAPKGGNVYVNSTLRTAQPTPSCGDGVVGTFKVGGVVQQTATIAADDTVGVSVTGNFEVEADDLFEFIVEKNGNDYCDHVYWDPTISYY
jgi:hypothetical protein